MDRMCKNCKHYTPGVTDSDMSGRTRTGADLRMEYAISTFQGGM